MRSRYILVGLLVLMAAQTSSAGIIFGRKKEKVDPKQRIPELMVILKNDRDADKRADAAIELRSFDLAAHPEVLPPLLDALYNDKKPAVRSEALSTLSGYRPVSQIVGEALEYAVANDSSMRVRLQARSSLLQYHWAGYRSRKGDIPSGAAESTVVNNGERLPPPISTAPATTTPTKGPSFANRLLNRQTTPSVSPQQQPQSLPQGTVVSTHAYPGTMTYPQYQTVSHGQPQMATQPGQHYIVSPSGQLTPVVMSSQPVQPVQQMQPAQPARLVPQPQSPTGEPPLAGSGGLPLPPPPLPVTPGAVEGPELP